jgi:enoyl-[acyl-carrier protein] reductase II
MVNEKATVKEILESMMKGLEEAKENLDKRMSSWK